MKGLTVLGRSAAVAEEDVNALSVLCQCRCDAPQPAKLLDNVTATFPSGELTLVSSQMTSACMLTSHVAPRLAHREIFLRTPWYLIAGDRASRSG